MKEERYKRQEEEIRTWQNMDRIEWHHPQGAQKQPLLQCHRWVGSYLMKHPDRMLTPNWTGTRCCALSTQRPRPRLETTVSHCDLSELSSIALWSASVKDCVAENANKNFVNWNGSIVISRQKQKLKSAVCQNSGKSGWVSSRHRFIMSIIRWLISAHYVQPLPCYSPPPSCKKEACV